MEKFFKPVHSPSATDEIKLQKNHHHHRFQQHQDQHLHRYAKIDDNGRNTDDSQGHHRHHRQSHYLHDSGHHDEHHPHQFHQGEDNGKLYNHYTSVTLSRASSSSSLSSSSSSSSYSSWYTETSGNDTISLQHVERPQHSLSCSNISDVQRNLREDDSRGPIVFATVEHDPTGNVGSSLHDDTQRSRRHGFAALNRGHSRSDEGFLQCNEGDVAGKESKVSHINYGPLYKTTSLNRSLAFSEENIVLGVPRGPKRAVSSTQLPSKGILKKKEHHNDIRKAKSMEVISPRVTKGEGQSGQKGKGVTQVEIEQARANFVEGKLQFSAFLDEITKQVMSPSDLNTFGVNCDKTTEKMSAHAPTSGPVKPQLPPKKHRRATEGETAQPPKQAGRPVKACNSSRKQSDSSNPEKLISYSARTHQGSPPPSQHPHPGSLSQRDRMSSPTGGSLPGERYSRYGPLLTDGTSTSPEPSHPKKRHHRKQQVHKQHPHPQHFPQQMHQESDQRRPNNSPPSSVQGAGPGFGSESSSIKSDSSRARDTGSTATSQSSEQSGRHQSQHMGHSKQHRDMEFDTDHLQALQEENADLHQNLLQTVVCIESLEAELQRTRDELCHVKEKYKSLLQTHTGTKQTNNILGEHLHIASESLSSERKYLMNRVSQLGSELEEANRTIAALESINVPCLIKELLEKHFDSPEAIQTFLTTSLPTTKSYPPKVEGAGYDWMTESEAGSQRVTAFLPVKQNVPTKKNEGSLLGHSELSQSPPFSVDDISTAIYKKMAASFASRPQPVYPQSQQSSSQVTNYIKNPPDPQQAHVGADSWAGRGGLKVLLLEQEAGDVNSMSAQQILDDFMQHLQTHKEGGGGKEQQSGQEWASGVEQTGKVAD
ncbi:uncharacterized protein ACNS7B_011933 isoform 2-T2 [Menidia menidia]